MTIATLLTLSENALYAGSLYVLVGFGFSLMFFARKFFDLSYGVLIPVGGYGAFVFRDGLHLPVIIAVACTVFCTGLVALAIGLAVFDSLQTKRVSSLGLLVASLGVASVFQSVLAIIFSSRFRMLSGFVSGSIRPWVYVSVGLTGVLLLWFFYRTSYGKALRAMRDDRRVATAIGIHTKRVTSVATFLAGAIAGLVGVLVGIDTGLDPTMGFGFLLKGVTAALLGGFQGVMSIVWGALSIGGLEQLIVWKLPGAWKEAVVFAVLLLVLRVRAQCGQRTF